MAVSPAATGQGRASPRMADLLVALSRVGDLGFSLEIGSAGRSAVLAARMATAIGLPAEQVRATMYAALLHHVGCAGYAHESARLLGDDLRANAAAARTDLASPSGFLTTFLPLLVHDVPSTRKAALFTTALARGRRWGGGYLTAACEVGRESARRLGLPEDVQAGLFHVYDLWRDAARGRQSEIPAAARIARLCGLAVLFDSLGGPTSARSEVGRRAGGMLDPGLVDVFVTEGDAWLAELDAVDLRTAVLAAEPPPHLPAPDLPRVARVFADLADLKSPTLTGHSRGVARLAAGAAGGLGLDDSAIADLEVAGLLHDVGRVAVSSAVWDKPSRLRPDEWEQVRLHPYQTERILSASVELARLAPCAGRHHERLDGSGYHRGCRAADLSTPVRLLAVADRYRTLVEERPHRPARTPDEASRAVLDDVREGRLDAQATAAVLEAAGSPRRPPAPYPPGGLSPRELEVAALVAKSLTNREIADRLVISPRTAEHHVQHVYAKLGVSSRAAVTLFAVEHGLVDAAVDAPDSGRDETLE